MDSDWHPHLLELNPQPDLRSPEPLKLRLMRDALLLVTPAEEEMTSLAELRQRLAQGEDEAAVAGAAETELEASRATEFEPLFPAGASSLLHMPAVAAASLLYHSGMALAVAHTRKLLLMQCCRAVERGAEWIAAALWACAPLG